MVSSLQVQPEDLGQPLHAFHDLASLGRLNTALRFELESVRHGLVSLQRHNRTIPRAG